jgi:hypothetical protein
MARERWTTRTDPTIVEVAEALGIPSDLVAAVGMNLPGASGQIFATFSPDYEEGDETIYGTRLLRDADGILREIPESRVKVADSLGEMIDRETGA